jgi:hypothetical protein
MLSSGQAELEPLVRTHAPDIYFSIELKLACFKLSIRLPILTQ